MSYVQPPTGEPMDRFRVTLARRYRMVHAYVAGDCIICEVQPHQPDNLTCGGACNNLWLGRYPAAERMAVLRNIGAHVLHLLTQHPEEDA